MQAYNAKSPIIIFDSQGNTKKKGEISFIPSYVDRLIVAPVIERPTLYFEKKLTQTNNAKIRNFTHQNKMSLTGSQSAVLSTTKKSTYLHTAIPLLQRYLPNTLIGISLFVIVFLTAPLLAAESQSALTSANKDEFLALFAEQNKPTALTPLIQEQKEKVVIPEEYERFQLEIPAIGLNTHVTPNVDTENEDDYTKALKAGVAHAKGTTFPGEKSTHTKTTFIFGHSTNGIWNIERYNALFYDIKLLKPGDEVVVWFWGKKHMYKVTEQKVVDTNDVSFLAPQTEKEQLILQTCWPPGTTFKRLLVFAEPSEATPSAQPTAAAQ